MEPTDIAFLLAAGFLAGGVNAIAGGGSLVTFPALIATGLSPVSANVSNSIAVAPGYLASVAATREDLRELTAGRRRRYLALVPTAVVGTVVGCVLLLAAPPRAFELVVPFLVLGAAAVLSVQERLKRLVTRPHETRHGAVLMHLTVGVGSVYGGYFGAALGVMLVAVLGVVIADTLIRVSALKNAVSALVGVVTLAVFAWFGPVHWPSVAVVASASIFGGYAGSRLARRLPAPVLRGLIVVFAVVVGIALAVRTYGR